MTEHDILVGPGVVAAALRVDPKTAQRRIDAGDFGDIIPTPGGHRRVRLSAVQAHLVAAANREAADSVRNVA